MPNKLPPISLVLNPWQPRSFNTQPPAHLQRAIDQRWREWEGWVRVYLLLLHDYRTALVDAETARLRQRHAKDILAMRRQGITMRLVRKHRLDDPRIADEVRTMLIRAVMERRRKARVKPRENLANQINIAALWLNPSALDGTLTDRQEVTESSQAPVQLPRRVYDPQELQRTIEAIRKQICGEFQLTELRDPELKVRSHRQVYVVPRQLAMYLVRQLTGASLQEIGRQFGRRHHTTVLHCIKKVAAVRQSDEAVAQIILHATDAATN